MVSVIQRWENSRRRRNETITKYHAELVEKIVQVRGA